VARIPARRDLSVWAATRPGRDAGNRFLTVAALQEGPGWGSRRAGTLTAARL